VPLVKVLQAEDQPAFIHKFVKSALDELAAVGIDKIVHDYHTGK